MNVNLKYYNRDYKNKYTTGLYDIWIMLNLLKLSLSYTEIM